MIKPWFGGNMTNHFDQTLIQIYDPKTWYQAYVIVMCLRYGKRQRSESDSDLSKRQRSESPPCLI